MGEVAADPNAFLMSFQGRPVVAREVITELDAVVDVIADRLNTRAAAFDGTEHRPGKIGELLGIAIAAAQQIDQRLVGKLLKRHLWRVEGRGVRPPTILPSGSSENPSESAEIAGSWGFTCGSGTIGEKRPYWVGPERAR